MNDTESTKAKELSGGLARHDEIDIINLIRVLWDGKWWIAGLAALAAVVSIIVVINIPNQYKAEAVLTSTMSSSMSGLSGQLGGLASLAGITLGGGNNDESQVAMEALKSWAFVDKFIRDNQLEVPVFAAKGWNKESKTLEIDSRLYDERAERWVRDPPRGKPVVPTSWELYNEFSDMFSVTQDKKSGLVTVSVEYYSPELAGEWVNKLVKAINEHMRQRKLESANKNILYLQEQVDKTSVAEMKSVFYQLIENEIKNKMLAEASPEYQFVTVSPALVPEEKSKPKRALIVVLFTMLGGMLGMFVVLTRRAYLNGVDIASAQSGQ